MGGLEVLRNIEQVPTDEHDRPTRPLMIAKAVVLVNPFEELDEVLKRELEFEKKRREVMEQQVNVEKQAADKKQVGEETGDDDAGDRKEANSNWNGSQPSPRSRQ